MDLFKNQFFLSTEQPSGVIPNFLNTRFHKFNIYHHLSCEITFTSQMEHDVLLIGFIIDSNNSHFNNLDVITKIALKYSNKEEFYDYVDSLSGRFVLAIKDIGGYVFIGDACCLKRFFYTTSIDGFYAGSSVSILNHFGVIKRGGELGIYNNSEYVKDNIEHFMPSGLSTRDSVRSLIPNHMLKTEHLTQKRFWPRKPLKEGEDYQASKVICTKIIKESIQIANNRYDLSFPVTAGWDARLLLSLAKDYLNDMYIYTLKYRDLNEESTDIYIPRKLLQDNNFIHNIIDCTQSPSNEFRQIYEKNTEPSHFNDWGIIANGLFHSEIKDKMCLKGNCSEIARCYYFPSGKKVNVDDYLHLISLTEPGWEELDFIVEEVKHWFAEAKPICEDLGYDILDLFYWEHRMGSWQAQSQLEWDISQEVFTPYNNRKLLEEMLGINTQYRSEPLYLLYKDIISENWEESLKYKINPKTNLQVMRSMLKKVLDRAGLLTVIKRFIR